MRDEHEKSTRPILKLSLNLPALERLIGGDSEIEVALQRGVAARFAEEKLREVFESKMHALASSVVDEALRSSDLSVPLAGHRRELRKQFDIILTEVKAREEALLKDFGAKIEKALNDKLRELTHEPERRMKEKLDHYADYYARIIMDKILRGIDDYVKRSVEKIVTERVRKVLKEGE